MPTQPHLKPLPPLTTPWWLGGKSGNKFNAHLQTIWSSFFASPQKRHVNLASFYQRERWATDDGDFIDVDWVTTPPPLAHDAKTPLLVLFHGLEGSSASPYALALALWCQQQGWRFAVAHFRSCSGTLNLTPRFYHMSDHQEADWILKRFQQQHQGPLFAASVSLGANVLLRWLIESRQQNKVTAAACICCPLDAVANAQALDQGVNRRTYTRYFLQTLREKVQEKQRLFPDLVDLKAVLQASTFTEFDGLVTAPLHGFKSAMDYWTYSTLTPEMLQTVQTPTLLLNPLNDPIIPAETLPSVSSPFLTLSRPVSGGHLGFASGAFPGNLDAFVQHVGSYFMHHL